MGKRTKQKQRDDSDSKRKTRPGARKAPWVPPPDCAIWPEQYRGKNWKSVYAILFAGSCQLCACSSPLPRWRELRDKLHGEYAYLNFPEDVPR